ncbi:hypothetical protein TWF730_003851 [Orbilia blumenaviensis]|uniref:DUF7908 domain-containing protein n=1 Tax=Orbilia blumenaviensis TaxID=1796055 RepID=A0AAV9U125_9PEZI
MARPLFILTFIFSVCSFALASTEKNPVPQGLARNGHRADSDCHARRPIGYITPSYGAIPVPITEQGQPVTTYIPTAIVRQNCNNVLVTKYLTSTYIWYSTYIPGYQNGKPQFISRGDQALTLPPKEPPKYSICTTTVTTTGTVQIGKKTYNVDQVPAKIEYTKEVSRSFGTCKAQDYFEWSQQNTERASRLELRKIIGGGRIKLGHGRLRGHRGVKGSHEKHAPRRLTVDYVRCHDDVCNREVQDWSVGYRSQVKKRVIAGQFSGWCDGGRKPCELCADIRGYGNATITVKVDTPGPCTISTRFTTRETVTRTITRTRAASNTVHTAVVETQKTNSGGQVTSLESSSSSTFDGSRTASSPESTLTAAPESQTLSSNTVHPSSSQTSLEDLSSSHGSETTVGPTEAPSTGPAASQFRIRIRPTAPTKRLLRRQSTPWYVGVFDNTMAVVELPEDIATFSISNQQLKLPNSNYAFADPDDLVARGPILVADTSTGPSTVFSIESGTNRLLWTNGEFQRTTATYCIDDDYDVNGVYAGEVDDLCDEVQLIAEFTDGSVTQGSSTETNRAMSTSSAGIESSLTSTNSTTSTTESTSDATLEAVMSHIPSSSVSSFSGLEPTAPVAGPPPPPSSSLDTLNVSGSPTPQCTPTSSSKNQIENPGFESNAFIPWAPSTKGASQEFSISTANPNKGAHSVLIEITSPGSSVTLTQTITTCQGRTYSGAVWLDLGVTGVSSSCSLYILVNGAAIVEQAGTAGSYSEIPFEFTAAGDTTSVGLLASCTDGVTKGTFHIDDVEEKHEKEEGEGKDEESGKEEGKSEGEEGGEEGEEHKHAILVEIWHMVQMFGDVVERVFILILGDL